MDLKRLLAEQGAKLLQDPRVQTLLQDERVTSLLVRAFELQSRARKAFESQTEQIARLLNLATRSEMRELKRALRRIERELARERGDSG